MGRITDDGKKAVAEKIGGLGSHNDFKYLAVGSDGSTASSADTQLGSVFTGSGLDPVEATVEIETPGELKISNKFVATADKVARETGVFEASSSPAPVRTLVQSTVSPEGIACWEDGPGQITSLLRDSQGNIYACVLYNDLATVALLKSIDNGTTWTEIGTLPGDKYIQAGIDSNDIITMVFNASSGHDLYAVRCANDVIGAPALILASSVNIMGLGLFVGANGDVHVFRLANESAELTYRYYSVSEAAWKSDGNSYLLSGYASNTSINMRIAYDASANLAYIGFFYWVGGDQNYGNKPSYLTFSPESGGTYSAPALIIDMAVRAPSFSMDCDQSGVIHFVFADQTHNIWYCNYQSGVLSTPAIIETPPSGTSGTPIMAMIRHSKDGRLHLVYNAAGSVGGVTFSNYYHKEFDGTSWGTTELLLANGNTDEWAYGVQLPFNQYSYQVPDEGYQFFWFYGKVEGGDYIDEFKYYGDTYFAESTLTLGLMLSRRDFGEIYLNTDDSVTIITKISIN